jgi:hypothetical protein
MLAEGQIFNLYNSNGPRKEGDRLLIILSLQLTGCCPKQRGFFAECFLP